VRVKKHFKERVYVAPFHLEFLRHRDANDFAAIQVCKLETVPGRAEDLCNLWRDEWLEIVGNCSFTRTRSRARARARGGHKRRNSGDAEAIRFCWWWNRF
jgi:hypothetical protein